MTKIVVFSDIHCGYYSRTDSFSVPGAKRQEASNSNSKLESGLIELLKSQKPDYIMIAGDLTSIGSPQEYSACEKEILKLANEIGLTSDRIICCMGNHDVDYNIVNLWDREDLLKEDIVNYRKEKYQKIASAVSLFCLESISEYPPDLKGPAPFSGVYEANDFVAFVLNTGWLCGPTQEYSHGKLSEPQLLWFEAMLNHYRDDTRKKVALMHHHPFNYPYPIVGSEISQIEEGPEIVELAENYGIDLVIHGHRHHPKVKTELSGVGSPVTFLCAGSLSVNASHRCGGEIPNTVHFIDLDKGRDYFLLYNYSYTDPEGWQVMNNKQATPMDGVMKVGKVFDRHICVEKVLEFKSEDFVSIEWDKLDECLQFMRYQELLDLFREQLGDTHNIIGSFPETVALCRKV